ncbi:hypothetical protein [Pseudomonas sp. P8_250]|uniref:hypothetical protein n=1 Tax=Pseudomonas sp. P8_250 TaxID=3043446 RepID=UPI002A370853|nr:hypothetical protein [Pseudomonas sp. P8_250]MDX9668743.1 hypothetical protein [Pseudomonas sp. P8_250]
MAGKQPRANLLDSLVKTKPGATANPASVGEAPMEIDPPKAQVEQPAHVPEEKAPTPQPVEEVASPAGPTPTEPRPVVIFASPEALPENVKPVVIAAPVHARRASPGYSQLSIKLSGERLARFEEARYKLRIPGQDIATEALDIWLTHNGF